MGMQFNTTTTWINHQLNHKYKHGVPNLTTRLPHNLNPGPGHRTWRYSHPTLGTGPMHQGTAIQFSWTGPMHLTVQPSNTRDRANAPRYSHPCLTTSDASGIHPHQSPSSISSHIHHITFTIQAHPQTILTTTISHINWQRCIRIIPQSIQFT